MLEGQLSEARTEVKKLRMSIASVQQEGDRKFQQVRKERDDAVTELTDLKWRYCVSFLMRKHSKEFRQSCRGRERTRGDGPKA